MRRAIRELTGAVDGSGNGAPCSAAWARFLSAAFAPRASSAKVLAASLGVCPSTLMSRFFRAGLPSPKQYVAYARLVWACRLAEQLVGAGRLLDIPVHDHLIIGRGCYTSFAEAGLL